MNNTKESYREVEQSIETACSSAGKALDHESSFPDAPDLVCLSHLRWNFVYQRPQHLLSRCAQKQRVLFIEEPIFGPYPAGRLDVSMDESGVWVVVPHLVGGLSEEAASDVQ